MTLFSGGEAELSFPRFLDERKKPNPDFSRIEGLAYRDGTEVTVGEIARVENLDDIKIPDYDAIKLNMYIEKGYSYQNTQERNAPILATRGCPYRCIFCSVPLMNGKKIRKHSVDYMMKWINLLYSKFGIRGFNVIDDNFTFDVKYAKAFCREVIRLGYNDIEFNSPNGIRMQRGDSELWKLMRLAGWRVVTIAPESGSTNVLQRLKKDLAPQEVPGIVKEMQAEGLKVAGFFMIGCPGETVEDLQQTKKLIQECRFDTISVTNFQPVPGTPIFEELVAKKEISSDYLPTAFADTKGRAYIPSTLQGFDFEKFRESLHQPAEIHASRMHACVQLRQRLQKGNVIRYVLYGAGEHTNNFLTYLEDASVPSPTLIIDDAPEVHEIMGIPVIPMTDLGQHDFDLLVLSTDTWEMDMAKKLIQAQFSSPVHSLYLDGKFGKIVELAARLRKNKPSSIALYGAGKHTRDILDCFEGAPLPPLKVIADDTPAIQEINGVPVVPPAQLSDYDFDTLILSSDAGECSMLKTLKKIGFSRSVISI